MKTLAHISVFLSSLRIALFHAILLGLCFFSYCLQAQIFYTNSTQVFVGSDAILFCNGGILVDNNSLLTNEGTLVTTNNSTLVQAGNFHIASNSTVDGSGTFRVEQDWINDAFFIAQTSTVELFGNTQQFIRSNNGTSTLFHDLTLLGTGVGLNRQKTLLNVDAASDLLGIVNLNDRELNTTYYTFTINNPDPNALVHINTFNNEGFVSSENTTGFLIREMNQPVQYLFPVGSSTGIRRYRPVEIKPDPTIKKTRYSVRFNNFSADNDGYLLGQHEPKIEKLNSLFYHTIKAQTNNEPADIQFYYIAQEDGQWSSIGNWQNTQNMWRDITQTGQSNTLASYQSIERSNWLFQHDNTQYVLIHTELADSDLFFIPNTFTPNGDDYNAIWQPIIQEGFDPKEYELHIYNRWGESIFSTNDMHQGWDGNFRGQPAEQGVYTWKIVLTNIDSAKKRQLTGHINLLR